MQRKHTCCPICRFTKNSDSAKTDISHSIGRGKYGETFGKRYRISNHQIAWQGKRRLFLPRQTREKTSCTNKIEAERNDYQRLLNANKRIPKMLDIDMENERLVKEYIDGDTVFDMVKNDVSVEAYLPQVCEMAQLAKNTGLNIDYFPTNFIVQSGLLYYIDYECNIYMDEWSFENWGVKYWSKTPESEDYLKHN